MLGISHRVENRPPPPILDDAQTHVMHNRLILPLLCAASVAFAAAPFSHDGKAIASTRHHGEEKIAPIVSTFDITRPKDDAEKLRFSLRVTNNTSKMLELRYPDGQTHDFVVKDFAGKEVWKWSEGRMFTSAMRSETLKGKGATTFEESWNPKGLHGSFTAVAILRSNNFPIESTVQFVLP
jgi:hypothetical protein